MEQVRQALALGTQNFYLYGHSWGGILAIEYALRYQQHLAGLIISNMMASTPEYNQYAQSVLMPEMDQSVLAEIKQMEADGKFDSPRYMELLIPHHYVHHILRMPHEQWPDPVNRAFRHINQAIYAPKQGPSELGASGKAPALGPHRGPRQDYRANPHGSHLALYDDQQVYFDGLIKFIRDIAAGSPPSGDSARRNLAVSANM